MDIVGNAAPRCSKCPESQVDIKTRDRGQRDHFRALYRDRRHDEEGTRLVVLWQLWPGAIHIADEGVFGRRFSLVASGSINIAALLDRIAEERRQENLLPGWTAWIAHCELPWKNDVKPGRPWCRGRLHAARSIWFPRTTKRPSSRAPDAVFSPAGQLPALTRDGWFLANAYLVRARDYAPEPYLCDAFGVLPEGMVNALHERLQSPELLRRLQKETVR